MRAVDPELERSLETTLPAVTLDPEALLVQGQNEQLVREALVELPPKYRLPLVYAAIAGLDYCDDRRDAASAGRHGQDARLPREAAAESRGDSQNERVTWTMIETSTLQRPC